MNTPDADVPRDEPAARQTAADDSPGVDREPGVDGETDIASRADGASAGEPAEPSASTDPVDLTKGDAQPDRPDKTKDEYRWWPEGTTFGRADKICLALLILVTILSFAMLPARPLLLTWSPLLLISLTGSRTGMVATGALAATGALGMPAPLSIIVPVLIGTLSIVKFDLVYWWAGKLWGDWFITMLAGQSKGSIKRAKRAERIARRWMVPAIAVTYIPFVPIPASVIYAVLGASGTSLKKFAGVDLGWAVLAQVTFFSMGWFLGEPAVELLDKFADWALWVAVALLVGVVFASVRATRGVGRSGADEDEDAEDDAR